MERTGFAGRECIPLGLKAESFLPADAALKRRSSTVVQSSPQCHCPYGCNEHASDPLFASLARRSLALLFRDPFVGTGLEQVEGQRAAVEHLIVELA